MERFQAKAAPLNSDYLCRRSTPLRIEGYHGSVDTPHDCLHNTDAVVCVELWVRAICNLVITHHSSDVFLFYRIEHLFPETEMNLPYNIFGYMKPKIAIFTTPNSDYNCLFGGAKFPTGFRHDDHKFEWSREQFRDW